MNKKPIVTKLTLRKDYKFMYENFVISTQHELYLLLEKHGGQINALKFDFILYKYGYPNDEGLGVHPMSKFGLSFYGLFRVDNSEWIKKLNEKRPKTSWDLFGAYQHYIVTFKDVTLDVISKGFKEVTLTADEITELTNVQVKNLDVD
jgi:hypothetical protein